MLKASTDVVAVSICRLVLLEQPDDEVPTELSRDFER